MPLGPLTWYGVGGCAKVLAHPRSEAALARLVRDGHERGQRLYVLGAGANLLVRDCGVDGVVIRLDEPAFAQLHIAGGLATVGAGYDLFKLVRELAKAGLAGLETVAGIPASVGGAVRMNAGGAFGEIGACVDRLRVMDERGAVRTLTRDDVSFSYRHSSIVEPLILDVTFRLAPAPPAGLIQRVKEIFEYKKNVQPMGAKSAGCAFKNPAAPEPPGSTAPCPLPPVHCPLPPARISAGKLIDQAGLKSFRIGGAAVSDVHGNFIHVVDKSAKADDVLAVIEHVQQVVRDRFGVTLEREVVVWP